MAAAVSVRVADANQLRPRGRVVAIVLLSIVALLGPMTEPADAACADIAIFGVRGSGEKAADYGGFGKTVLEAVDAFDKEFRGATARVAIAYPARGVFTLTYDNELYFDGADEGIAKLKAAIKERAAGSCLAQRYVLFGYSQGAMVVNRALLELAEEGATALKRVAAVGLIADPQRYGHATYTVGSARDWRNGASWALRQYPREDLPRGVWGKTDSVCKKGDLVCEWPLSAVDALRIHKSYAANNLDPRPGWAAEIGRRAASRAAKESAAIVDLRGSLVSASGSIVYVDWTGWRHAVTTENQIRCHGGWNSINYVNGKTWDAVMSLSRGESASCFIGKANDIIRHPDGDSYVLVEGSTGLKRRWIPTTARYHCERARGRKVLTVERYHISDLPSGENLSTMNCIARAPEGDAHYLNNEGKREWVPDGPTFECEVGRGIAVFNTTRAVIDSTPSSGWHYCLNKASLRGEVLRHHDGDAHYIHPDDTRTWIPDAPTWDCRKRQGKVFNNTRWREYVDAFKPTGWDYCFDAAIFHGKVLRHHDGDAHYIHPDNTRTWLPDGPTWDCRKAQGKAFIETRWRKYVENFKDTGWDYCYDVNTLKGKIVKHPDGDSHYVDGAGRRHWIHNGGVFECLRNQGVPVVTVRWRDYINRTPEGEWAVCGDTLWTGQKLDRGLWLRSSDGRFRLDMQSGDGNLVLYNSASSAIWATNRTGGQYTVLQSDGNLVTYTSAGGVVWASNTAGSGANRLVMQSDGNLVLYSPTRAVWATNTGGR